VAKEFKQRYQIDYEDIFSPIIKSTTIRIILSIAVSKGWHLRNLDVQNAFLHANLEDVYMWQSPSAWYTRLSTKICELGFKSSKADTSLFYFHQDSISMFILVYIDDIIIVSSDQRATERLLHKLSQDFTLKDMGELHYFLGIEVCKVNDRITLTQKKYASDLL
jgi:hypothetical protein